MSPLTPRKPQAAAPLPARSRPRSPRPYRFTPARRAALDRARAQRSFEMTPAKWAAVRKAAEANRRQWRLTPARRRAMSINGRKMQRASVEKFRMTERRQSANLANLRKAWAAERTPESCARSRFNHLQHGLQVRTLEETMHLLGEDPKELEAHRQGFARLFAPEDPVEEKVVGLLAAAVWRRLRLYKAQAYWESRALQQLLAHAALVRPLDAEATLLRAYALMTLLLSREKFNRHDHFLTGVVERQLRTLLRLRGGDAAACKLLMRESAAEKRAYRELEELRGKIREQERDQRFYERFRQGGPEVEAALARFQAGRSAS